MTKSTDLLATGPLLAQDKLDRFRALGAFGGPAWQSAVQMRAMLLRMNRRHCADYFARPNLDPDQKVLRWTAEVAGNPIAWDAMTPDEQAQRALDLEVVRSDLKSLVQELSAKGGSQPGSAAAFSSLLEQAMKVPTRGNFLYFVGKQPVIAFWGFENQENDLAVVDQAPLYVGKGANSVGAIGEGLAGGSSGNEPPPPPLPVQKKKPWWLWLLALLVVLLLAAFLLRGCMKDSSVGLIPGDNTQTKSQAETDRAASEASSTASSSFSSSSVQGGINASTSGSASASGALNADGTAATPDGAVTPPTLDASGAAMTPDPSAMKDDAANAKDAKDDKANQDAKGPIDPKNPDGTVPPDGKQPPPDKLADAGRKPGNDKNAPPPADLPDMQIPKDPKAAQKMEFMKGQWKAGEGLTDTIDNKKVDMSFDIGKDGKGEVTYKKENGAVCKSQVQGVVTGGKVSIEGKDQVPCTGGGSFQAPRIECERNARGETECSGVNADKSKFSTRVQKLP